MEEISIRHAEEKDLNHIIEFNIAMALETENKVLNPEIISKGVNNLFKNSQFGFYIVAEIKGEVCACMMTTTEWSDWRDGLFLWIQSVYVKPEFRRRGIYTKMYEFMKKNAFTESNICGCRLYVEKDNLTAQKTYRNNGMEQTDYLVYEEIIKK